MILERYEIGGRPRWAADGVLLAEGTSLRLLLGVPAKQLATLVRSLLTEGDNGLDGAKLTAPIDPDQDVWACGVTYLESRAAREVESEYERVYRRVYAAERPEIFFKARGADVVGADSSVRIRRDSSWNVPEPELVVVVNGAGEVVGYTAGNDISSRTIEGENPLYLPQAKIFDGACAIGPAIRLLEEDTELSDIKISMRVMRGDSMVMSGSSGISQMNRTIFDLVSFLRRELSLPNGVFLMTGTGIVPGTEFSLIGGDEVEIVVGELSLSNRVAD